PACRSRVDRWRPAWWLSRHARHAGVRSVSLEDDRRTGSRALDLSRTGTWGPRTDRGREGRHDPNDAHDLRAWGFGGVGWSWATGAGTDRCARQVHRRLRHYP